MRPPVNVSVTVLFGSALPVMVGAPVFKSAIAIGALIETVGAIVSTVTITDALAVFIAESVAVTFTVIAPSTVIAPAGTVALQLPTASAVTVVIEPFTVMVTLALGSVVPLIVKLRVLTNAPVIGLATVTNVLVSSGQIPVNIAHGVSAALVDPAAPPVAPFTGNSVSAAEFVLPEAPPATDGTTVLIGATCTTPPPPPPPGPSASLLAIA